MMPSTPRSSSSCIVERSFTVHTCTSKPARWAARRNRGEMMRTGPLLIGTWMHAAPRRGTRRASDAARATVTASGPIDVHARPLLSERILRRRRSEKDPMQTRSPHIEPIDERDEWLDGRVGFRVDVHARLRPAEQQFLEAGDPHAAITEREAAIAPEG